jgi:hypothetical protein
MPLAAILCATAPSSDRPEVSRGSLLFAGQALVEYQARQAVFAGARSLFIIVDRVTPAWSRMIDRLSADGIHAYLVRDMSVLVRQLPRDADTLLFSDGMIVDQRYIAALGESSGNALLVVEDSAATSHLERIDLGHRWAGVARVAPAVIFDTLDLIGDWDLLLTLLRAVVQNEPRRIVVPQSDILEGRVALVDSQAGADLVAGSLKAPIEFDRHVAGLERYALMPLARFAATRLLRMQIPVAQMRWAAAVVAGLGLLVLFSGWYLATLLLFFGAVCLDMIARHVGTMTRLENRRDFWRFLPTAIGLIGITWIGSRIGAASDALHLAILSAVAVAILDHGRRRILPDWAYPTPAGVLVLLILGFVFGVPVAAFQILSLAALISMAFQLLRSERNA